MDYRSKAKDRSTIVTLAELGRKVRTGRVEVEHILGCAFQATPAEAAGLRELAALRKQDEKANRSEGLASFPLSIWLSLAADFAAGGYEALQARIRAARTLLPYALGFCTADCDSPRCWTALAKIVRDAGSMPRAQRRRVLECVNLVFSFEEVRPLDADDRRAFEQFIGAELLAQENLAAALCASRGFPSQQMLALVQASPEPGGCDKEAKSAAIASIRRRLIG